MRWRAFLEIALSDGRVCVTEAVTSEPADEVTLAVFPDPGDGPDPTAEGVACQARLSGGGGPWKRGLARERPARRPPHRREPPVSMFGMFGKITAHPGQRDALVAILLEAADMVGDAPGCRLYVVAESQADSEVVWVSEAWDSRDHHAASLSRPGVTELIRRARPLIAAMADPVLTTPVGGKGLS